MAYIGRDTDKISNVEVLDNITFDGSSSYTLQKGGSNFTPSSANTLLVSINGVVQAGNFTVSGSTINFGVAIAGTSTCDFILHYGIGLITAPSDGTVTSAKIGANAVTNAKLNNDIISGATELATEPADTDEFLVSDAGTLKRIDYSLIKGGGITVADQWRVTADFTGAASPISSNLERVDTSGQGTIGSAMTVSSGVFTFPVTGIYKIEFISQFTINDNTRYYINYIESTRNNGSSWTEISENASFIQQTDSNFTPQSLYTCSLFDCADTSNHKVRFRVLPVNTSTTTQGSTVDNETFFTFIRLGDT